MEFMILVFILFSFIGDADSKELNMNDYNDITKCELNFNNRNKPSVDCKHLEETLCVLCNPHFFNPTSEQSKHFSSVSLALKLIEAKKSYYGSGKSKLTDSEYDALETSLKAIDLNNPILTQVGSE